ncbi:Quaternary ammonium compound-resistance protein SugE [Pseudonocardia sp. Ae406_Ps2]|nr:Quaternary ammonium compound-resistance protein SugE [Pseudonocardia sp. Ae406_Ps2]OLL96225.1 Quaternary ammonium compound-resistance protein SugE [Pseudonocardia sp. Ae406_Ps2]
MALRTRSASTRAATRLASGVYRGMEHPDRLRCPGGSMGDSAGRLRRLQTPRTDDRVHGRSRLQHGRARNRDAEPAHRHLLRCLGRCRRCADRRVGDQQRQGEGDPAEDHPARRSGRQRGGAQGGFLMSWLILIVSAVFEAVWATALGMSAGLSRPIPTVVFLVFLGLSMVGLALAMRSIPVSVAYSVWIGIGAVLTVAYAMLTGDEQFTPAKAAVLTILIGCIVGLKFTKGSGTSDREVNDV